MKMQHCLLTLALVVATTGFAEEEQKPADGAAMPKITFDDHVLPIFRAKCASCHSADQAKGDLVVDNYAALMRGGASGEVVTAGDPDDSRLWALVTHAEEPIMPPNEAKLPDEMLNTLKAWIEGGALEKSSSTAKVKKKASLGATIITTGRPEGPPPLPEALPTEPLHITAKGDSVTALATNPWSQLAAVSGFKQVLLYHTGESRLVGVLPFPEGVPYVLKFSRNGSLLLAGGGRGGQSGRVVVWDVRTGKRVFEIGDEYDTVLAADISSDHSLIALGGPRKVVRVYNTATGELAYEIKKHTDWITAVEFSPDSVLLATGDRSNGLFVWEAYTGREFYPLPGHGTAITSLSWRPDSNVLASSSEDGTIKLWEMNNGTQVKNWGAHSGGGVTSVQYTRDGRIASVGRDNVPRLWNGDGGQIRAFPNLADVGLQVAFSSEDDRLLAGDWTGIVRMWSAADGAEVASLVTNPEPLIARLAKVREQLPPLEAAANQTGEALAALQKQQADKQAAADAAVKITNEVQAKLDAMLKAVAEGPQVKLDGMKNQLAGREKVLADAKAALDQATAAKTLATQAAANAPAEAKPAADQQLAQATLTHQAATGAYLIALQGQQDGVVTQTLAAKEVEVATAALKPTQDELVAKKAASDQAVAAAVPTPEFTKQLTDAQAAATAAAAKRDSLIAIIKAMEAEQGRTHETVAAQ